MSVFITLTKDEVRLCSILAVERWLIKWGSVNKLSYAQGKENGVLEHDLNANVRSITAEWAVAKHFGVVCSVPVYPNSDHPTRKDLPDVSHNGEVRTVRTRTSIPYWEKDRGKLLIGCKVIDADYYSEVEIFGHFKPTFEAAHFDDASQSYRVPIGEFV